MIKKLKNLIVILFCNNLIVNFIYSYYKNNIRNIIVISMKKIGKRLQELRESKGFLRLNQVIVI